MADALFFRLFHESKVTDSGIVEKDVNVAQGLNRLASEKLRLAVACRYLAGLSEAETAVVLGCPPGTVKSRVSRGLDRLRASLAGVVVEGGAVD